MDYDPSLDEVGQLQDRSPEANAHQPKPRGASSGRDALLWPVYILFRPRQFYESIALMSQKSVLFACAWIFGMSMTIDRISNKMGSTAQPLPWETSWEWAWGFIAGVGLLTAAIAYAIGGWWYRVRLRWSGVQDPDPKIARRVYITAAQVFAAPSVLATAFAPLFFATPLEAADSLAVAIWGLVLLALRFWSYGVSYIGVRTVFRPKAWPARIWFLILPVVLTVSLIVLTLVLAFLVPFPAP